MESKQRHHRYVLLSDIPISPLEMLGLGQDHPDDPKCNIVFPSQN